MVDRIEYLQAIHTLVENTAEASAILKEFICDDELPERMRLKLKIAQSSLDAQSKVLRLTVEAIVSLEDSYSEVNEKYIKLLENLAEE